MAHKNEGFEVHTSPVGIALFPQLNEPDAYEGKGPEKYSTRLIVDGDACEQFKGFLDETLEVHAKDKGLDAAEAPYIEATDADKKPIPGALAFKFTVNSEVKTKKGKVWDRKPVFFDANGEIVQDPPDVGTGSRIRVNFMVYKWTMKQKEGKTTREVAGITLQPVEVQLISVKSPWKTTGFGAVEGEDIPAAGGAAPTGSAPRDF